jgi:hypothetical protein
MHKFRAAVSRVSGLPLSCPSRARAPSLSLPPPPLNRHRHHHLFLLLKVLSRSKTPQRSRLAEILKSVRKEAYYV